MKLILFLSVTTLLSSCGLFRTLKGDPFTPSEKRARRGFKYQKLRAESNPYTGQLQLTPTDSFTLVKMDSVEFTVPNSNTIDLALVKSRLIPEWIFNDQGGVYFFHIRQVDFIRSKKTLKRFSLLVYGSYYVNPTEYFLELKNKTANKNTEMTDFIKGAELTYLSYGIGWL